MLIDLVKDALREQDTHQFPIEEASITELLNEFIEYLKEEHQYSIGMNWDFNNCAYRHVIYSISIRGNIHYFAMLRSVEGHYCDIHSLEEVFPTPVTLDMLSNIKCFLRQGKPMLTHR